MTTIRSLRTILCAALAAAAFPVVASAQGSSTVTGGQPGGTSASAESAGAAKPGRAARRDMNRISSEELQTATQSNLYDLIRTTRPRWMTQRGQGSFTRPEAVRVYVDGSQVEGIGALRSIDVTRAASVEFLDSGTATIRWGTGHPNGAILVTTGIRN